MIARYWRGLAKATQSEAYVEHLRFETFPGLKAIPGFVSASVLSRTLAQGVEFLVITQWSSLESIREFAGENIEAAVVPQKVRDIMIEYDPTVRHYEVVSDC